MAVLQGCLLAFLGAVVSCVEVRQLYVLQQWWSYPAATAEIVAAREAPWRVLVTGSSHVYSGILPAEVEQGLEAGGAPGLKVQALGMGGAVASTHSLVYRAVRQGHRPRAVVIAVAPRDMTEYWDRQTLTVRAHAGLRDAWSLAVRAPRRRWAFPWYALTRDLGVPMQALADLTPAPRADVQGWLERAGSGWPAPGRPGIGLGPMRGLATGERLGLLRVQVEQTAGDAGLWLETMIEAVRRDGGEAVLLLMPQSDWGTSRLPAGVAERFEASLQEVRRRTGVPILRATAMDPALRRRQFYLDYVDHLSRNGARRLSRALGLQLAALLGGGAVEAPPLDVPPDGVWAAPACVQTAAPAAAQQLLEGWWPVELGGRWSQAIATLELGWAPGQASALRVTGFNWERVPVRFQAYVDDRPVLDDSVAPGPFERGVGLAFSPGENPVLVRIERHPPFVPARAGLPDTRELGIFVTSVCLAAAGPPAPPGEARKSQGPEARQRSDEQPQGTVEKHDLMRAGGNVDGAERRVGSQDRRRSSVH
jgi:hypothetical protein